MTYNQRIIMTASIIKGGNILSIGHNKYNRLSYPWKNINGYSKHAGLHAEFSAIKKLNKQQLKNSIIIIYGVTKAGNRVLSKPCLACYKIIKVVGIKKIIFFDKRGQKYIEKVK